MAQLIKTCQITNGSQTVLVLGSNIADRIKQNFVFLIQDELVPYTIAQDAVWDGTNTVVQLAGNYIGATNQFASGVFVVDYTYPDMVPIISQGDVGTAAIFANAMYKLQNMVKSVSPDGLADYANMYNDVAVKHDEISFISTEITAQQTTLSAQAVVINSGLQTIDQNVQIASDWANKEDGPVDATAGLYSAKFSAREAQGAKDVAVEVANVAIAASSQVSEQAQGVTVKVITSTEISQDVFDSATQAQQARDAAKAHADRAANVTATLTLADSTATASKDAAVAAATEAKGYRDAAQQAAAQATGNNDSFALSIIFGS